jgi:hypothetical protein
MLVGGHARIYVFMLFNAILCEWKHSGISSDVDMASLQLR